MPENLIDDGERLRRLRIAYLPTGPRLQSDVFDIVEEDLPALADRQVLVRVSHFSVDAGSRASLDTQSGYVFKLQPGDSPVGSASIGQIIASRHPDFSVGAHATTVVAPWHSHLLLSPDDEQGVRCIRPDLPLSAYPGILGTTGFTSYAGVFGPFHLDPGETFVVSAAAGAVGTAAGQFARMAGARVVGIAGGREKCDYLVNELGFDAAVDYKADLRSGLDAACPDGIDYYFENVGGDVQKAVFDRLNVLARVAICGQMAQYSGQGEPGGPNLMPLVLKRISLRGFLSLPDYPGLIPRFEAEVPQWLRDGKIKDPVTITDGLENAWEAINNLVDGRNIGKQLIRSA